MIDLTIEEMKFLLQAMDYCKKTVPTESRLFKIYSSISKKVTDEVIAIGHYLNHNSLKKERVIQGKFCIQELQDLFFSSLTKKQQKSLTGKKLNVQLMFDSGLISRPFEAIVSDRKAKCEFTASNTEICEVTYSDHPDLLIKPFDLTDICIVIDNKRKVITKFKYNPKTRQGTIQFQI